MRGGLGVWCLSMVVAGMAYAADWPQFRGPTGDGRAPAARNLPTTWGNFLEPPAWKTALPGTGWSSPVVVRDRIWLTAAEQTALTTDALAGRLAEPPYGEDAFQAHQRVTLWAVELDAATGRVLRRVKLFDHEKPRPIHLLNSYASPTPVSDGTYLVCDFGALGTACLSLASGDIAWRRQFVVDSVTGPANSPVLCGERVILVRDGSDTQYVAALDLHTGKSLWKQPRPRIDAAEPKHRRAFSTPLVIQHRGRRQIIAPTAHWIVSYDPATGRPWWQARQADGHALVPRPVFADGIVYVCSGYHQAELTAVRVDGHGDVSDTHVVWTCRRQVPRIASPLVVGDELYMVSGMGIVSCLDRASGRRIWQHRLPGNYAASPLWADGKLYFTSQEGVTTVLRPGRTYQELARNELFGQTLASLAVAGESLLIRTDATLYCVRKTPYDNFLAP